MSDESMWPNIDGMLRETISLTSYLGNVFADTIAAKQPINVLKRMGTREKLNFNKRPMARMSPAHSYGVVKRPRKLQVAFGAFAMQKATTR